MKVFSKEADTDFEIHPLIRQRWSPRAFAEREVEPDKLQRIFEAARWAPSSMNEQPWRFLLGFRGDAVYQKIMQTLVDFNQKWAFSAPVLILSLGRKVMNTADEINDSYRYDVGQSLAYLSMQAMHEGVYVHQMGGFDAAEAVRLFKISTQYKPITVSALGYIGNPEILPEKIGLLEYKKRERRPLKETVFSDGLNDVSALFNQK